LATRCQPDRDTVVLKGIEGYVIDPSAQGRDTGSKIGFDATRGPGERFDKVSFPPAATAKARRVSDGGSGVEA